MYDNGSSDFRSRTVTHWILGTAAFVLPFDMLIPAAKPPELFHIPSQYAVYNTKNVQK